MNPQRWSPVAVIVISYLVAVLYQTHHFDRRIDDLKEWIRAEFRRVDERIDHLAGAVEPPTLVNGRGGRYRSLGDGLLSNSPIG